MVSARGFIQHHFFTVKRLFIGNTKSSGAGFTLVEVTLVLGIIGILTSLVIVAIDIPAQLKKARDGTRKSDMRSIQLALELWRTDQGSYPTTVTWDAIACSATVSTGGSTYMQKKPCDPKNTSPYIYTYSSGGTTYTLFACLERGSLDSQADSSNNAACTGSSWSYTVQNP